MRFRFVLKNAMPDTQYVRFGGGSGYINYGDVVVTDDRGNEVWTRIPSDALFELAIVTMAIAPRDSLVAVHVWDQRDKSGGTVTPGVYFVRGYVHPRRSGMPVLQSDQKRLVIE